MHYFLLLDIPESITPANITVAIISSIATIATSYINSRRKNLVEKKKEEQDSFQAVLDASAKYRDEVKKDLIDSKKEVVELKQEISGLKKLIEEQKLEHQRLRDSINGESGYKQQLKDCNSRFNYICNLVPVGIFRTDKEGKCVFVNKKWTELSGINTEDAIGDGWVKAVYKEDLDKVVKNWNDATENHLSFELPYRFQNIITGEIIDVIGRAVREEDGSGKLIGYIGYIIQQKCSEFH